MSVPDVLVLVALILCAAEQIIARGRSLIAWAVILICVALLWGLVS